MNSEAWRDLSGNAVKLLLLLMKLSQGNNGWGWGRNQGGGHLYLGERLAAETLGVSRNTASRCFEELIEKGFLEAVRKGHFHVKVREATTWRLTFQAYPHGNRGPSNEWRNWPQNKNQRAQLLNGAGPEIEPTMPKPSGTGKN